MSHITLEQLLERWEQGEIRLSELVAEWPHDDGTTNLEPLQELVRAHVGVLWRVIELEGKAMDDRD